MPLGSFYLEKVGGVGMEGQCLVWIDSWYLLIGKANSVMQSRGFSPSPVFDHSPILLDIEGVRSCPSPFRFELMWPKVEGFKKLLRGWWKNLKFHGTYNFILAAKLKDLKGILKVWNKEVFGRVEIKKEALIRVSF